MPSHRFFKRRMVRSDTERQRQLDPVQVRRLERPAPSAPAAARAAPPSAPLDAQLDPRVLFKVVCAAHGTARLVSSPPFTTVSIFTTSAIGGLPPPTAPAGYVGRAWGMPSSVRVKDSAMRLRSFKVRSQSVRSLAEDEVDHLLNQRPKLVGGRFGERLAASQASAITTSAASRDCGLGPGYR